MVQAGIIYHCEGAGHAMRMLAIAERLKDKDIDVKMTGGGPGEKFLEMRGLSDYTPTVTDMRGKFTDSTFKALFYMLSEPIDRLKDLRYWIREEDPEVVVTDDVLGLIAAFLEGKKFYTVTHVSKDVPESTLEGWLTWAVNKLTARKNEEMFYCTIWDGMKPDGAKQAGPLAPKGNEKEEIDFDILFVPTKAYEMQEDILEDLEEYDVKVVGSENWETQPSLQPYISEADAIICAGYSTMMEASVAGTPCIMLPQTSEQEGVANILENYDGFARYSGEIERDLSDLNDPEPKDNGAEEIASVLARDLRN